MLSSCRNISYLRWKNVDSKYELSNYFTKIKPDVILHLLKKMINTIASKEKKNSWNH